MGRRAGAVIEGRQQRSQRGIHLISPRRGVRRNRHYRVVGVRRPVSPDHWPRVPCQVIATGLTPRRPGQRIKPDQRDARTRVRLFRAGELTAIHVPSEAEEGVRDFRRCREDVRRDVLRWTHRVVKVLDRHGRRYLAGRNRTRSHWTWLRGQRFEVPAWPRTLEVSLFTLEQALARLGELDREVETLAQTAPYRQAGWLRSFRGLDTLSAMMLSRGREPSWLTWGWSPASTSRGTASDAAR